MSEGNALQFAIEAVQSLGGEIVVWDAETEKLSARLDGNLAVIDVAALAGRDKAGARQEVERKLRFPNSVDTRWTQYLGHALLVRKQRFMAIQDVRVDFITPSGKFVRLLNLSTNQYFWSPVEDYEILEDLGVRITQHPVKPVARKSPYDLSGVQTPIN